MSDQDIPYYYAQPPTELVNKTKSDLIWRGKNAGGTVYRLVLKPIVGNENTLIIERLDGTDGMNAERWVEEKLVPWCLVEEFCRIVMQNKNLKFKSKL